MKAEEIQQKVAEAFKLHANKADCDSMFLPADIEQRVTDMVRSLVIQALEEAAQIAENPYGDLIQAMAGDEPKAVGRKTARVIRSLKDEIQEK